MRKKTLGILTSTAVAFALLFSTVTPANTSASQVYAAAQIKQTESPKDTAAPEKTEEPKNTAAPEKTEEPKDTAAPEKTEEPKGTAAPEKTEAPQDTTAPTGSSQPTATPAPTEGTYKTFAETFPDENFRGIVNELIFSEKEKDTDIITDDVKLQLEKYAGELNLSRQKIADLTGIELLKGVTAINADYNTIKDLPLRNLEKLTKISARHNQIKTIALPETKTLKELDFNYNSIEILDLSMLSSVEKINCANNDITMLVTAKLEGLKTLDCHNNKIFLLEISDNKKLTDLDVSNNHIASLDISNNKELVNFYADGNELLSFDTSAFKEGTFDNFELRRSTVTLTGVALGTQYGVILPTGATAPQAESVSNSGKYLETSKSIAWTKLTDVPATFTYQYAITGSKNLVTVTVVVDKTTMVKDALDVATPTNFASAYNAYNKIKLTWTPVGGASGYYIYRSTSSTGTFTKVKNVTSGTTASYINGSLACGTTYYYKMRAYRTVNGTKYFGSYTNVISRKAKPYKPAVTLAKYSSTKMKITWKKIAGANGYVIYRSTSQNGTYSKIKTISSGSTVKYINKGLKKRKTYYYKMRTFRTVNGAKVYSSYSSIKKKKL